MTAHGTEPKRKREVPETDSTEDGAEPAGSGRAKLFVNRGRRSGIGPDDVRWALVEGAVIPDAAIGSINVLERFSFVEIDAELDADLMCRAARQLIEQALEATGGKIRESARRLGIARNTLKAKLDRYGIDVEK